MLQKVMSQDNSQMSGSGVQRKTIPQTTRPESSQFNDFTKVARASEPSNNMSKPSFVGSKQQVPQQQVN